MKIENRKFEIKIPTIEGDQIAEVIALEVPVVWDEEIGEWLLTEEAHALIEDTKARHMGLLLPQQFRQLRQRHALTQSEIGELFQVGAKSWTRWETGKHRPSRSVNLLIKALFDNQISIEYLRQSTVGQSDLCRIVRHNFARRNAAPAPLRMDMAIGRQAMNDSTDFPESERVYCKVS